MWQEPVTVQSAPRNFTRRLIDGVRLGVGLVIALIQALLGKGFSGDSGPCQVMRSARILPAVVGRRARRPRRPVGGQGIAGCAEVGHEDLSTFRIRPFVLARLLILYQVALLVLSNLAGLCASIDSRSNDAQRAIKLKVSGLN